MTQKVSQMTWKLIGAPKCLSNKVHTILVQKINFVRLILNFAVVVNCNVSK